MYDVIVVGGGPAGSSAARRCAKLGLNTLLLDSATFPRNKLCGGAVSEYAISHLDFVLPPELIEHEVYGARVHFGNHSIEVKKPYRIAVTTSRINFDHYLLNKAKEAGVVVLEDKIALKLDVNQSFVEVNTKNEKFSGLYVIGCDGFNSRVARSIRPNYKKDEFSTCIEVSIPAEEEEIDLYIHNAIDIYLGHVQYGYGWVFPHKEYFAVGIGGEANYLTDPKTKMMDFLQLTGFNTDIKFHGYPIPEGGIKRKIGGDRILLAGDAAGFVDSFNGEGIGYAIRSGQLAAESIKSNLSNNNASSKILMSYISRCQHEIEDNLRYSFYLSRLMHRYPSVFLNLMGSNPDLLDKYLEVPARKLSYKQFFMWIIPRIPYFIYTSAQKSGQ